MGVDSACMRQACKITAAARALAGEMVRPGVNTKQIDMAVYDFIVAQGAKPSFLGYNGFPGSTCVSVNSTVIHGIPGGYVLQEARTLLRPLWRWQRCAAFIPTTTKWKH